MNRLKTILLHPRWAIVVHDLFMVWAAWLLAHALRYSVKPFAPELSALPPELPIVLLAQGILFYFTGLYRGLWRFASLPDLWNILRAAVGGTLLIALTLFWVNRLEGVPRSVFVFYPVILVLLLGGPRLLYRLFKDQRLQFTARPGEKRVVILGAGKTGEMLARDLRSEREYYPIGFLDDARSLRGGKLRGLPIFGPIDALPRLVKSRAIDMAVIAIPSATTAQMRRIVEICESAQIEFRTVPRLQDVVSGRLGFNELKDVAIEDLLGREPVSLDWNAIRRGVSGRSVLISGAGGSIGAELCRQIAQLSPSRITLLERSEYNLYRIEMELRRSHPDLVLVPVLGDVCDEVLVDRVLEESATELVFHAAAYKHVPMLEAQVREAVRNNLLGTSVLALAADRAGVERFVLISTDKAVNPVSVMGATKRASEIICETLAARSKTRFLTVRFGNVLNSAGSVVPRFREQIAAGGPVTVTHPEMARYFMTIPEACQLIMQTAAIGESGQIYVLDMGEPVRITYLADQLIRLAGKEPGRDIEIVYTGLRPGEKLFEELFHDQEAELSRVHPQILLASHRPGVWAELSQQLAAIGRAVARFDEAAMRHELRALVPEYRPAESADSVVPLSSLKFKE